MKERIALRTQRTEVGETKRVMFVPGGRHTVTAGLASSKASAEVTLLVDESTAAVLQASLDLENAQNAPQRALFDKNHEAKEAMAWPLRFEYSSQPEPGVYAQVEWSKLGAEYVQGKVMRAFSGSFFTDAELPKAKAIKAGQHYTIQAGKRGSAMNPARITGLDFPFAGTLTNDPAFRKILPLWANHAGGTSGTNKSKMKRLNKDERAALQSEQATIETEIETLKADTTAEGVEALQAKQARLTQVKTELNSDEVLGKNEVLEQALLAQRGKDADVAVNAAVKRGAIPSRDAALQATWKKKCVEDPEMLEVLGQMKGNAAVQTQRLTLSGPVITREDSVTVLKAYNAERDAKKKAVIYARDISKRIKEGEDLPIHASNTLGTLTGEIVAQRTLELLILNLPILSRIGTDFSAEGVKLNQEVNTRIVGIPGTSDYNTTTGYATENTVTTDVPVTIDAHKSCQVSFNANELASTSRRLFDELAPAMMYAIGKVVCDALYAQITAAKFTETAIVSALINMARSKVISIGGALSDRGVPEMGRTLLLAGSYFDSLYSDAAIVSLSTYQQANVITQGQMIPLHGFDVIRAANLPTTNNLAGFGFSKSALVLAARLPNDYSSALPGATGGGTVQTITEPSTGLSLMLTQFIDHQLGAAYARVALMYGTNVGQQKAGQRLTSA